MSRFWEIVFCVPLLLRRHVYFSNLKQAPSRKLPLTALKTVFSHLKAHWALQVFVNAPYKKAFIIIIIIIIIKKVCLSNQNIGQICFYFYSFVYLSITLP